MSDAFGVNVADMFRMAKTIALVLALVLVLILVLVPIALPHESEMFNRSCSLGFLWLHSRRPNHGF
jgi:flagellar biogenesis protein FliO